MKLEQFEDNLRFLETRNWKDSKNSRGPNFDPADDEKYIDFHVLMVDGLKSGHTVANKIVDKDNNTSVNILF